MANPTRFDLIIIGAGPGGYVAAIRAAQLGLKVACIEKEPQLGGTCLRIGCIPSKALLDSSERYAEIQEGLQEHGIKVNKVDLDLKAMMARKTKVVQTLTKGVEGLFKKNQIYRFQGQAHIDAAGKVTIDGKEPKQLEAGRILIATGSKPATLPGIEFDGDRIGSSTEALAYEAVPKKLIVIGAGYIGLEMGSIWRRLGAEVTVVEYLDRILPGMDQEIATQAQKTLAKQGLDFKLGCKVTGVKKNKSSCKVEIDGQDAVEGDRILVAVGRKPNTDDLGLESVDIETDEKGFITVDNQYQTSCKGVFAIGDVIGGAMLAHKAEEEAVACVEAMATGYGHVNYDAIPGIVYTHPEIASVGKTEEALRAENVDYRKGTFPFAANGRARAMGDPQGMVKILADRKTDRVLGVHIIGPRAGDLIAETVAAMEFGATSEDIARVCHAHPTLAEAVKEAALAVDERAIHF